MSKTIPFNIKINVNGQEVIVNCKRGVQDLGRALGTLPTGVRRFQNSLVAFAAAQTAMSNLSGAISNISGLMQGYIDRANNAAVVQTKLTTIMRQRMGASEADVTSMNKMISAQTQLGIVGGTVQRSGLQQLATFASQRSTLETLLPAMNNLIAQQDGVNATAEDAVGVANLMGKALMGNVGALTRVGITLTDHQKELIRTGDEYTRATTLAQAITDNVGNMNAELAKTDAGKVKQAANNFAALQASIGKALQPFQQGIVMFSQIGMAVTGVVQMGTAIGGVTRALFAMTSIAAISNVNHTAATAIVRAFTTALGMETVSITGATIAVKALTWAIRGLEVASVVFGIFAGISVLFDLLAPKMDKTSEASNRLGTATESLSDKFEDQRKQALAPTLTKYQELQAKWKSLKSAHEKNQFIKTNKDAFQQLGVSIDSVGQAEDFFVKNTKSVEDAMYARAEAAAAAALAEQEMQKALELESKVNKDHQRDKRNYKNTHHTGRTGEDLALDALVDNGGIKVTSKATQADERALRQSQQNVRNWNKRSASASARANKGLKPYQGRTGAGAEGGSARNSGGGHTGTGSTNTDKPALKNSLDWYDQQMSALRKKINATNNEDTAKSLQKQYKELEDKSRALKIRIGLEQPEKVEVKSYVEQLQDKLKDAQKQMDNATTVEARVEASANIASLQKQIDIATKGELTIEADVEPQYIVKGSEADKRQSYQNAQSKASNVQSMYDAGIIDKAEAERRIKAINSDLKKLGANIKPVKLQIETDDIGKAREALQNLGSSWGGTNQVATGLLDMVNMFKAAHKASQEAKQDTDKSGKSFNALGSYAAAGATGLTAIGSSLQQIGGDGAAAKAGAVMAAIGQIVLGFATYTAKSAGLGPWGWVAAIASGTAILASTIATVKGYATGGVLTGPTSSGDKILFRGNAGEMIFNTAQQRRLYAIANGSMLPSFPKMETVRPKVGNVGDITQSITISVTGKLRGNDMELMGKNTRSLGAKIGKRW